MARKPRPPRPPRRAHVLKIRLSDAEYAALVERAHATSIHTVAGYVRAAALGQRLPPAARPVPAVNQEQYVALGRAGGNLNQLARSVNRGLILTDRDLMPVLRQVYEDLQEVRRGLLGAGGGG